MSVELAAPTFADEEAFYRWTQTATQVELRRFVAGLNDDERAAFIRWLEDREWRVDPAAMASHLDRRVVRYRHFDLLAGKFSDAVEGRSRRQIWNLPARTGKSEIASGWGPIWALDRYPWLNIMVASYGDVLAQERGEFIRSRLVQHSADLRVQLARGHQRLDGFATTAGGGMRFGGIMSGFTGFGANGIVVDDPYKGWADAHSVAARLRVMRQYRSVLRFRLNANGVDWIIVCHTRWHEDDMTAELMAEKMSGTGEDWELVRLPMVAEEYDPDSIDQYLRMPDPLDRRPGELLVPELWDADAVRARATVGSYLTSAMEQQRPAPAEGGIIKRAWWKLEEDMPTKGDEWITSWDLKLKDKAGTGDFVCGGVWVRTGKDCWLVEVYRGQWDFPTSVNAIALSCVRWPQVQRHWIESAALGPEARRALRTPEPEYVVSDDIAGELKMTEDERIAVQQIRRRGLSGVLGNTVKEDKEVRLRAVSGYIEAGDVHVPVRAWWLPAYLDELATFPQGNDDQVDMTSQALSKLHRISLQPNVQSPEGRIPSTKPSGDGHRVIPQHMRAAVAAQLRRD